MNGLLVKTLRDQRRALIGWGIGVAAMAAMYVSFYPTVRNSAASLDKYLQSLPDAVKQIIGAGGISSPPGYLRSEIFSILGPVLFLVFAVGAGARAIAGEEEAGTLDLLLSTPIRRRRVLSDKALSLLLTSTGLALVLLVTLILLGPAAGMHMRVSYILAACVMLLLLALSFGAIALAVGCITGHRSLAIGITSGFAVFAFIVNALAPVVDPLKPVRVISPFRWYFDPDPLLSGAHPAGIFVFVGIVLVALVVAFFSFERRDLAA